MASKSKIQICKQNPRDQTSVIDCRDVFIVKFYCLNVYTELVNVTRAGVIIHKKSMLSG